MLCIRLIKLNSHLVLKVNNNRVCLNSYVENRLNLYLTGENIVYYISCPSFIML